MVLIAMTPRRAAAALVTPLAAAVFLMAPPFPARAQEPIGQEPLQEQIEHGPPPKTPIIWPHWEPSGPGGITPGEPRLPTLPPDVEITAPPERIPPTRGIDPIIWPGR